MLTYIAFDLLLALSRESAKLSFKAYFIGTIELSKGITMPRRSAYMVELIVGMCSMWILYLLAK